MSGPDLRESAVIAFPRDVAWVGLPASFPFKQWPDRASWAEFMTFFVYFRALGDDPPPPSEAWVDRTRSLIELGQESFPMDPDAGMMYQSLLFYDVAVAPIPLTVHVMLGDLPWDDARKMYSGESDELVVEGPHIEGFDVLGAEVGIRSLCYHHLDPEAGTLFALCQYAYRKDGLDVFARARFVDLTTVRDALPTVESFVRGIEITFGDTDG